MRLALFGSTARDDSDVDILVAFDGPATSERYFGTQFYLLMLRAVGNTGIECWELIEFMWSESHE